ncbi:MAG: DUF2723 domain-containing protein [Chthoniobacterales bacterium]
MAKSAQKKRRLTTDAAPRKHVAACAGFVFIAALMLYARTLAPTVTLVDSGELILAAHSLGVAHPPGFPLYVMLAHLASIIPIGSVAVRVNFASAFFAAFAAGVMTLVVGELLPMLSARISRIAVATCATAAGFLLACSRTLWSYATIAEVYTLNTLLILTILFLILRWRRRIIEAKANDVWLYSAAVVFGLALGVHHVTVASILPGIAVLVYRTEGSRFFSSKRLLFAALSSLGALVLAYSYLPFAAALDPILNWGDPRSFAGVWRHISGWQYQSYLSFDVTALGQEFASFVRLLLREFGPDWLPVVLCVAAVGLWTAFKRDRTTFWLLAAIVLLNGAYNLSYSIAEDKDAYYLPTFVAVVVLAGIGLNSLGEILRSRSAAWLLVIPLPLVALTANWPFNNRAHYFIAHDYVENIERTIAPNGLLLTLDWQVASPMLYTREIESQRRDVKVIDLNLLRRSWYFDYLRRCYPEMMERSRVEADAFLAELKQWEENSAAYAKDAALTERISSRFFELCQSLVRRESSIAPVYLTNEVLLSPAPESKPLAQWIASNYEVIPNGLVFALFTDHGFHDPGDPHLETRGLADGTLRFADDDVVKQKVLPAYAIMLVNRGRYLAAFGQEQRAAESFQRALDLNPALEVAREGLKSSLAKIPK